MSLKVNFLGKCGAELVSSNFGISKGKATSRMEIIGAGGEARYLAISLTEPTFFSSKYTKIAVEHMVKGKWETCDVWVNKESFRKRFSSNLEDIALLKEPLPDDAKEAEVRLKNSSISSLKKGLLESGIPSNRVEKVYIVTSSDKDDTFKTQIALRVKSTDRPKEDTIVDANFNLENRLSLDNWIQRKKPGARQLATKICITQRKIFPYHKEQNTVFVCPHDMVMKFDSKTNTISFAKESR